MKINSFSRPVLFVAAGIVLGAVVLSVIYFSEELRKAPKPLPKSGEAAAATNANGPVTQVRDLESDWIQVLAEHPELRAESDSLHQHAQRDTADLSAALVHVDPQMAPLLKKLAALESPASALQTSTLPTASSSPAKPVFPPPQPTPVFKFEEFGFNRLGGNGLTPNQWNEFYKAQLLALQNNPELVKRHRDFERKLKEFLAQMRKALSKEDPALAQLPTRSPNVSRF